MAASASFAWTFRISETANRFHVVSNLAEWSVYARTHYNRAWIEETGPLTQAEQEALAACRELLPRYGWGAKAPGRAFGAAEDEDDAWARAARLMTGEDLATLRGAMAALEPRFQLLWTRDRPRLEALCERVDAALRAPGIDAAVEKLAAYLASDVRRATIDLLMSRGRGSAGGANAGPGRISLEVLELADIVEAADVVLHELGHLMEQARFLPRYRALAARHRLGELRGETGWDAHVLVKEALHGALCPSGCLSPMYGIPCRDHLQDAARARERGYHRQAGLLELTGRVLPLVQGYLDADRSVDDSLLEAAVATFQANRHTLS